MKDLVKYFRSRLPEIYIKTLPIYIISILALSLGILYFPKGKYWIVCMGILLLITLICDRISKYITIKSIYNSGIISSSMRFNIDNYSIVKMIILSIFLIPISELLYLVSYTLVIPGIIIDILFRTYFMQSIISGNSTIVLLVKKNEFPLKVRITDYSKGSIVTIVVNTIYRIVLMILFYMFIFKSYQELFSIRFYNTFITLVVSFVVITIVKILLQPYMNYKDTLWAMMCVDPALGGIEVNPYGTIEDNYNPNDYYKENSDDNSYNNSYNNLNYNQEYDNSYNNPYSNDQYTQNLYNLSINSVETVFGIDGEAYNYYPGYGYYEKISTGEIIYYDPQLYNNGGN